MDQPELLYDYASVTITATLFALISEANALGTTILRVHLLPEKFQHEASKLLREYVDLRIALSKLDLTRRAERKD